ncbi:MAG: biotin transporter BioY [Clostridium sp.]
MKIKDMTKISICIALLCVSAFIAFPVPFSPAPFSAQTIMINIIALVLSPKHALAAVGGYILLGAFGIPIFAGGTAGLAKLAGPTGGYLIGFLVAAPIMSYLKGQGISFKRYGIVTIFIGMPIIYIIGTPWLGFITNMDIKAAILTGVAPYVVGDILKCLVSALIASSINRRLR